MTTVIISPGTKKLPWQPLLPEKADDKTTRNIRWIWEEIARFLNNLAIKITDEEDTFCVELEDTDPIVLDCDLVRNGKVFWVEINGNRTVQAINGVCGQPLALICKQGSGGGFSLTFANMFRYGTDIDESIVTFGPDEGVIDFSGFLFFQDCYHIVSHVRGYTLT